MPENNTNTTTTGAPSVPPEFLSEFKSAMSQITREQMDERIKELQAKAVNGDLPLVKERPGANGQPVPKHQAFHDRYDPLKGKGVFAGQYVKAHLIAKMTGRPIGDVAKSLEAAGKLDPFVAKALNESSYADGGATVHTEIAGDYIDLLRSALVFTDLGIVVRPMSSNEQEIGRMNAPATASYRGELVAIVASQLKTGKLELKAKEVSAFTSMTNKLLADAGPLIDQMVRDDLIAVMALRTELAGLRGTGASDTPKGLRYLANASNILTMTAPAGSDSTFQEIDKDLSRMIRKAKGVDGQIKKGGFIFSTRVEEYLYSLSSSLGVYPYRDQLMQGKLRNFPYKTTSQIPENLGGGGNQTEVMFADFDKFYMGEREEVRIDTSREASFTDVNGATVHAFQQGVTAVAATAQNDFALKYDTKASILTACTWGISLG